MHIDTEASGAQGEDAMSQAWVQVIGLAVEYLGVLLLAWEWFAGRRQDVAERRLAEAQARREEASASLQRVQADNPQMQRHLEMTREVQRRMTARELETTRASFGGLRARVVAMSLVLVSVGFVLQMLGTWPGCCRALGISPLG